MTIEQVNHRVDRLEDCVTNIDRRLSHVDSHLEDQTKMLHRIEVGIHGNGGAPGLKTRLAVVEASCLRCDEVRRNRAKQKLTHLAILYTTVAGLAGKLFYDIFTG